MRKAPLVPVAIALIVGIAVGHALPGMGRGMWLVLLASSSLAGGLTMVVRKRLSLRLLLLFVLLTSVAVGGLRGRAVDSPRHWTHLCHQPSFLDLRLTETPVPRERSWKVEAEVERVDGRTAYGSLRLFLRRDSAAATLRYGDRLTVHGYADTLRGRLYVTSDHYLVTGRDSTSLRARSERLRMTLVRRMQGGPLDRRQAGMAEALTLGWRGDLDKGLQRQFRDAGIMHLLCVSGLHVGLLAAMVGWLLFWLGEERRGRIVRGSLQLLAVWGFALLTGLAPATVRAALMFSLFIVSRMMGRRTDTMNLLAFAALVMLMADPQLLFDVGWQLSFSAVAGILLARPLLRLYHVWVWKASVVSFAATLATLPVTLAVFHQFQPWFLVANVVIVPAAALLLGLSLLYLALPCGVTAWPLDQLLGFCDHFTAAVSRLPGAVVDSIDPGPVGTALIAVAVFFVFVTINVTLRRYQDRKNRLLC